MGLSVKVILSIALIVIFVIAAASLFYVLFPYVGTKGGCKAAQRLHIERINSTVEDAKAYGITYVLKFRVEDCVECMWFEAPDKLRIRWTRMSTTDEAVTIGVSVPWNNFPTNSDVDGDPLTCGDDTIKGSTACVFEVKPEEVINQQC